MSQPGVPAWKRLGLKLKYANEIAEKVHTNGNTTTGAQAANVPPLESQPSPTERPKKKRKTESKSTENSTQASDNADPSSTATQINRSFPSKTLKKHVSFSADTKASSPKANGDSVPDELEAARAQTSVVVKKPKRTSAKTSKQHAAQKPNAALDYLNQYHTARSSWKFNKNRETWILKHVLSESDISRDYDLALAQYIHGLQGAGARERLKTHCLGLLEKEEDTLTGNDGTGESARVEQNGQHAQRFRSELIQSASLMIKNGDESEANQDYKSWIRTQPRPKLLLWAIGLDEESRISNGTDPKFKLGPENVDGVSAAAKAKARKRKNRTAVVDYESSSSSSSSSSSDSDSESDYEQNDSKMSDRDAAEGETSSSESDEETSQR